MIELMIVVVIIAVLATLATYGVRNYILQAKTVEAREVIASIMAGQEAYFDEMFEYLDVSGGDPDAYYPDSPENADGTVKIQWGADSPDCADCLTNLNALGVTVSQPVAFRYSSVADTSGSIAKPSALSQDPFSNKSPATSDYYTVFAVSDLAGDGAPYSTYVGSSYQAEIIEFNAGE